MIRVALDTNILAYYAGVDRGGDDTRKVDATGALMKALTGKVTLVAPVQALGELFVVLVRRGRSRDDARQIVLRLRAVLGSPPSTSDTLASALDCATTHRLQFWDALILTAAAEASCALLLSEDMHPGFVWRGVNVVNPLAGTADPRLAALLA